MRAAVPDLDPAAAAADTLPKLHAVGLLVEKWQSALHRLPAGGPSARFEVECSLVGAVAERCVEFAALDGVIYACAAAAVRASIDGKVKLTISPVRPTDGRTAPDARFMFTTAASFSPDPAPLFMPGTGADNLALCAEMVGEAYGVDPEEAVEDGYVGAAVRGGALALWVHWPTA
ncbi:hypothetical protein DFJ74DRAFT_697665 [Hyaloraphidium curvatum]|nr:hypothetical protein DFJ74DRAFT_697665 [Hyaloraphidium curvatum]